MNQLKAMKEVGVVVVIVVVLAGLGILSQQLANRTPVADSISQTDATSVAPITYQGEDGKTVLELLKTNHSVTETPTSNGVFVQGIDGIGTSDNQAWIFYVDGSIGLTAADQATTANGQTIEWRYESF